MKAAFYRRQGPAASVFELGEQPTPEPARGEVRVKLRTSGVNPSDWKSRSGLHKRPMPFPLVVPHSDGAGHIDAVGEGVSEARIGERVWTWNGQFRRPFGTAAEYIALPSEQAVELPAAIDDAAAACLGIPALTALQGVRLAGAQAGRTVLVTGGAGAVGHYAIQMAKLRGATVLSTVSSEAKAAHARAAGADHVINYRSEDVSERVKALTGGAGVDAVVEVDLSGNAALYPRILKPHAVVSVYGMSAPETALPGSWMLMNSTTLRIFLVYDLGADDRTACLDELNRLLADGRLRHSIARRLPLARIAEAHDLVEQGGVIGNVVLDIDG